MHLNERPSLFLEPIGCNTAPKTQFFFLFQGQLIKIRLKVRHNICLEKSVLG